MIVGALPSIFANDNICDLDGYVFQERIIPQRVVGSPWFSTKLSSMMERVLRVRLDGEIYNFVEARNNIRCTIGDLEPPALIATCERRVISVRRGAWRRSPILLLVDETRNATIAVIGETLRWGPEGISVLLIVGGEQAVV